MQMIAQLDASVQSIDACSQAVGPLQSTVQGIPAAQVIAPVRQAVAPMQPTEQGMPGGHITPQPHSPSPHAIEHTPPEQLEQGKGHGVPVSPVEASPASIPASAS